MSKTLEMTYFYSGNASKFMGYMYAGVHQNVF